VFTVDTALITLASVVGTVAAIVVWRRLFPSPMPAWFDPINTWYRNRAFPPAVALAQFSVASGRRVLELWRACWVLLPDRLKALGEIRGVSVHPALLATCRLTSVCN
jgi:hypothetical protein